MGRTLLEALVYTLKLCAFPTFFMVAGSLTVQCKQPSATFVQMTQHLGAGIVLSAVATELLPSMSAQAKTHWGQSTVATLIGFFLGVAMMVSVEHFTGEGEEEEEGKAVENEQPLSAPTPRKMSVNAEGEPVDNLRRRKSLMESYRQSTLGDEQAFEAAIRGVKAQRDDLEARAAGGAARESTSLLPRDIKSLALPWTLIIAVFVDSMMDGLLIGISAVAGENAGIIMTVALTIEMMFLGLTFSAGVAHVQNKAVRYLLILGAPCMILVGGAGGALAAAALSQNPIMQIGLIAFGVAALLYLVTEELLIEAHEHGGGHKWYVDLCFFAGFILSVLLEQAAEGS